LLLHGYDYVELVKTHLAIHLDLVSNINIDIKDIAPIDAVVRIIDAYSNPCYSTQYLFLVAKLFRPRKFVETGVFYGTSSAFILKGLENHGGRLFSIDLPNAKYLTDKGEVHEDSLPPRENSGFAVPSALRTNWELRIGDSRTELPKLLNSIGQIDIFLQDSMNTYDHMTFEFETALKHLRIGGLLLSDDADWNDAFKDFCRRHSLKYKIHKGIGITEKR
jgi:hypothetical protein